MTLIEIVTAIVLSQGSHVHDPEMARVEATAFIANVQPHVPLATLLAVAWVESRFSPTGSARDRANHVHGVMQIRCDDTCESYFDPSINIRRGAALLALRWQQVHSGRYRPRVRARVLSNWVGAYYHGSVPATRRRRAVREWYQYAARVHAAENWIRARLARS